MRALTYIAPHQMQLENRQPAVPIDSNELLINIAHVGICGSDMHAYLGHDERRPPPLILGHGQWHCHAAINPLVVCGACVLVRAASDYLDWSAEQLYIVLDLTLWAAVPLELP